MLKIIFKKYYFYIFLIKKIFLKIIIITLHKKKLQSIGIAIILYI
jgi:hypothetical protein